MNILKLTKIKRKEAYEEKYEKLDVSKKKINRWWLLCWRRKNILEKFDEDLSKKREDEEKEKN